jgi:hypothetical protein
MTMTMEPDTITGTMVAHVSTTVLASINSLAQFADSGRNGNPVLAGLQFSRHGEDHIRVHATNRYVLAQATYAVTVFDNWGDDATLWVDQSAIKQALAIAKTNNVGTIGLGYDHDTRQAFVDVAGTRLNYVGGQPSYPSVHKLFDDLTTPNGANTLRVNPKFLAMLAKVVTPESKQNKDQPWELSFWHEDDSAKPKPMMATLDDKNDTWSIRVLIQPNVTVR